MEPIPPQMTKSPFPYEQPWPYGSNYGPHFCYDHNNFPGYYTQRPCYPHVPHTPAYSGGCPLYGEPFSAPYYPQSHYTMELPRYEYDKYMPRERHCCGCPNHVCNQKEDKTVKIEEQEPNVGKKENNAMVPIQFRNFPYPYVWTPQEYYGDKQPKNPTKPEVEGYEDRVVHDKKLTGAENVNADVQPAFEPRLWNGWFPFDVKGAPNMFHDGDGIKSLKKETINNIKECENGRMAQKDKSEQQKRSEFPFPFIWLPYINKQEEGGSTNNQKSYSTPERVEEVPYTFKSFPVKSPMDEGVRERIESTDVESKDRSASDVTERVSNQRNIPVKQIELNHVKNDTKVSEKREMNLSEENETKKDSHSISKQRSTSPPKRSKLPPVCLRVDPLPRKKSGNGSSRSPSPPASKGHSKACETNNTPSDYMTNKTERSSNIQNVPKAGEEFTPKVKTIEVSQNIPSDNMTNTTEASSNIQNVPKTGEEVALKVKTIEVSEDKTNENKGENKETNESCKKERRVLSDADAAVLIQAVYRGHLVRKWESLKKLKQIAEVSKEVTHVRDCVKAFEGSSDLQNDGKQKIAIGETIMRLLLKLDTIQGLHPSLREIRKSLARELVTLQERLDSIMVGKYPQQQIQESDAKESVEASPMSFQNGEHNQEHQEETTTSQEDSSEVIRDGKHQDQLYMEVNDGRSENHVDPASNEATMPTVLLNRSVNEDISQMVADADATLDGLEELPVLPVGVLDEDVDESEETNTSEMHAMKVLPAGVLDEDATTCEETNTSESEVQAKNEVLKEELPVGLLDDDAKKPEAEKSECNTNDTQLEQSLVEEKEEVKSSEESDGWVKIELPKDDDKLKVDVTRDIEESETGNDTKLSSPESDDHRNEEACLEGNDVNSMLNENEAEEKLAQQETKVDAELNGDMKLLEENEKLRKLMKELLDAGNEQLSVISNLTGRVKDLEKKLAKTKRSKKVRTKRHKQVTPKMHRSNSSE
ncbi:hypothetical protein TSUD_349900 [Trifolium subterraneum]|uniref:BAG domain-containing protein n=1 Tax=Trifolium subterraneum TaxID=3900 RepID=A0A2Z6PBE9_TRISU|nr:hypothetical protein TSUD_349900 [Trifolium subterraneum]